MKLGTAICLAGIAFFAVGCAEERKPADDADAWEISADNTPAPTAPATTNTPPAPPPQAVPTDVVAVVKGSAFKIEGTTETQAVEGDALSVGRYFFASAPVELKTSVTLIETDLEGRNTNGAVPLVAIQLSSTSGKYRSFQKEARPIDGKQLLQDQYDIGPGTYKITVSYFKDTVGEVRPLFTLNSVTFRNMDPTDDATPAP